MDLRFCNLNKLHGNKTLKKCYRYKFAFWTPTKLHGNKTRTKK